MGHFVSYTTMLMKFRKKMIKNKIPIGDKMSLLHGTKCPLWIWTKCPLYPGQNVSFK